MSPLWHGSCVGSQVQQLSVAFFSNKGNYELISRWPFKNGLAVLKGVSRIIN